MIRLRVLWLAGVFVCAAVHSPAAPGAQAPAIVAPTPASVGQATAATEEPAGAARAAATGNVDAARSSVARAVRFLLDKQNSDGSWGTSTVESLFEISYSNASFYAWKIAGGALSCMALRVVDETPERRAALDKALGYLCDAPRPKRGSDWDIDSTWASLYCFIALVDAAQDPRFQSVPWKSRIAARTLEYYAALAAVQDPFGGWGYYEGPVVSRRPTWSTSFSTACVIPALVDAERLGLAIDPKVTARAVRYVERCRLPNGAYTYDLTPIPRIDGGEHINQVKGSLGRIQVANWALRRAGVPALTDERIREGLELFFAEHKFLDVARMRPVPHEAYYANAGYFYFFGHYHAALAINELPPGERDALHARLRPHLVKAQWQDGSSVDFPGSFYVYTASTSFSILALEAGLHPERFQRAARADVGEPARATAR